MYQVLHVTVYQYTCTLLLYVTCSVKMSDKSSGTVLRYRQLNVERGFFGQNEIFNFFVLFAF